MDPTHPWRPYAITRDEDGELHSADVTADWAMQHKEPVTRTEIPRPLLPAPYRPAGPDRYEEYLHFDRVVDILETDQSTVADES